ncbi:MULTISPECIES: aeruginoside biosynthesis protein AerC [Planktothrix]|jgi:phenylpropionate dioxygenase-like ring-hydroxylating dioxygenase large terminal subunit|uniref:Rieske (2Fe-2S) domain-containing protein n=3 Tax=Planktothrix TaxID=54304 RepID=A0A4P5ZF93_PLAAG|nr:MULTISPECIES: aeruginoside biosynthesis protein AerC [Planktothrix]CAH2574162.1 Carnitine monooxygenase oxygenase subunit [Planktothrix rubescens]CAC5339869.1 AerC protein [Planktothrix rubescens NIVA-CYA 18]CAD5969255.1 Carnitine monooxygenase oxygenase subunit [Planktothrix rubescens NIVA-CYA 18]CAQ48268.1 AerC protein [Planktothrix prolifica NIVA-CYA 98]GDZ94780.1 Rieske (2Fe-2S) domain-containing protein [Planktothrix agardhii CCAP 1459/11A]
MNHIKIKSETLNKLFINIGQQQGEIVYRGRKLAQKSQKNWDEFITTLLEGKGNPQIGKVYQDLSLAVEQYNQEGQNPVAFEVVYHYFVAKIIRLINLNPADFPHQWYLACKTEDISHPGDFITLKLFQEPLVIVHQEDGTIGCFLNVCTHRQSPVFEGKGCASRNKKVLCPYHGWAFDLDGNCQNAPGASRGEFGSNFDLNLYGLQEIEVKQDGEYIFVKLLPTKPEENETKRDYNSENIGVAIANLLDQVSPGYAEGKSASLPEAIRLWLKIGYLEKELTFLVASLNHSPGIISEDVNYSQETELLIESLVRELKQAILMVENQELTVNFGEILERIGLPQEMEKPTKFNPFEDSELGGENDSEDELAQLNTEPLPIWIYGDTALFTLEIDHLIAPTWQFVCHINEVPEAGNFTWLDIIGERAYVIRTNEGELFAGRLKHLDERNNSPNFSLPNYGLEPIDIDIFYGFVFIRFSWEGARLKELWYQADLLKPYNLEAMQPINGLGRYDINVEVDYKLLWENFLEDYHFPMMHKGLTRRFKLSSDCEGINGMIIPMKDPPSPYLNPTERKYYDCAKSLGRHSWEHETKLQEIAAQTQSLPETLCYSAFCSMSSQEEMPMPFSLSIFPEHVQTFSIVPGGARESRFHVRSYAHPVDPNSPHSQTIKDAQLANIQLLIESLHEDIRVNYITQDSVSSILFEKKGIFSIAELDVAKFQQAIRLKLPMTKFQNRTFLVNH